MSGESGSASLTSDLVATFELVVAGMLLLGMFVVRRGNVRAHMLIQSSMVLVNLPVILIWMVPQYLALILPELGGEFAGPSYFVPSLMLALGAAAEGLGIYILLVAGTNLLPDRYRFRRYKLWMRTELALWWSVVGLGLTTYLLWYASG